MTVRISVSVSIRVNKALACYVCEQAAGLVGDLGIKSTSLNRSCPAHTCVLYAYISRPSSCMNIASNCRPHFSLSVVVGVNEPEWEYWLSQVKLETF